MKSIIKKFALVACLAALFGLLFFPKEILLQLLSWKASSYCLEAFGAQFSYDKLVWEKGEIVFHGGKLYHPEKLNVTFQKASLIPFLNWKERSFGGALSFDQLKIVHVKQEAGPIFSPLPPSFKLLTLHLETQIDRGELILFDFLARPDHFFQTITFDVTHQIHGREACGNISFACQPGTPPLVADFHSSKENLLKVACHLENHSLPILSHMVSYFFQGYLPQTLLEWEMTKGAVDGDLELTLASGIPFWIKGRAELSELQAENRPLEAKATCQRFSCVLDADFSHVETIEGSIKVENGKICLEPKESWWRGLSDLDNVHSEICVKEGKLESSILRGTLMGMDGEIVLDWNEEDSLMEMGFWGRSETIAHHLPEQVRAPFRKAFPNDYLVVDASLKQAKGRGLELNGLFSIADQNDEVFRLHFGCLMGENELEDALHAPLPSFSQSLDSLLEKWKGQFCLSEKRFGWVHGENFPLEKFLSPFLLKEVKLTASGRANFKGTFDERYLILFYEGREFKVESPHFELVIDRVESKRENESLCAVHYVDLQSGEHCGFLPVTAAKYWQKNFGFHLEELSSVIHFHQKRIHFDQIEALGEGVHFEGNVAVEVHSPEQVELTICVDQLNGSASDARQFLAHFKPSFLWELPIQGEVFGSERALYFHYLFTPAATLLEGSLKGTIQGEGNSFFLKNGWSAAIDYDCLTQEFRCSLDDKEKGVTELIAKTLIQESGKQILLEGRDSPLFGNLSAQILQDKEGKKSELSFNCGPWEGKADLLFEGNEIFFRGVNCWVDSEKGFSLTGKYDKVGKELKGELIRCEWDLSSIFAKKEGPWKPHGKVTGSGPFSWDMKRSLWTVEGLKMEIPTGEKIERIELGRCNYDVQKKKIQFEGFDFSLTSEKIDWLTHLTSSLFSMEVDLSLVNRVKNSKKAEEPFEGHLSLEICPDNVWIFLHLKDGEYWIAERAFCLRNFCLVYDPRALNIWTELYLRDQFYWLHLATDSAAIQQGTLSLSPHIVFSDDAMSSEELLTFFWSKESDQRVYVNAIQGIFSGMEVSLTEMTHQPFEAEMAMRGRIDFDPVQLNALLPPSWREKLDHYQFKGHCYLEGDFTLSQLKEWGFKGKFAAQKVQVAGVELSDLSFLLEYAADRIHLSNCRVLDSAGSLFVNELQLLQKEKKWHLAIDHLQLSNMRLARLKSPWTRWGPRDKPFFKSLLVRSFVLDNCRGTLDNLTSLLGSGTLEFTNIPKKSLLSSILFLPTEITARIGLDLTALVPARGIIDYQIADGKIQLNELKEMYSDGKLSRFYLAEGFPAYIDFDGNLNLKLRTKQYNLLMKLAEFFTITVKGSILNPSYSFNRHTDADD